MRWLLVASVAWTCPGGLLGGLVPAAARPLVCAPRPLYELYDPAQRRRAEARVRELGAGADLLACVGLRCRTISTWTTTVSFQEEPWTSR